jgi:hypothetical protein
MLSAALGIQSWICEVEYTVTIEREVVGTDQRLTTAFAGNNHPVLVGLDAQDHMEAGVAKVEAPVTMDCSTHRTPSGLHPTMDAMAVNTRDPSGLYL